jgi:uncharacterized membrane protein HdeD (DUF308 family)
MDQSTGVNAIQDIANKVTKNRKRLMWFGILSIILGSVGIFISADVTMASVLVLGILVILVGLVFVIETFAAPQWKGKLLSLLLAVLYLVAGAVMVANPMGSAIWLTLFLSAFLIAVGILRIVTGFMAKDEVSKWGWIVFSGILSVVLGILIAIQWPVSGLWIIGLFISIEMIMQGINAVVLAQKAKDIGQNVKEVKDVIQDAKQD